MIRSRSSFAILAAILSLVAVAPVRGLGTQRKLSQFGQQTWGSDSGLPQNTVHSVVQTRDGFLWIATEAGLVRFDGIRFRVYDTENTPQFRSDIISDLREGSDGSLWISTTGGLVRERGGGFTLFGVADGLPSSSVSATYASHTGKLLAITAAGLAVLDGSRFQQVAGAEDLQMIDGSSQIAEDDRNQIWVAGSRSIYRLDGSGTKATKAAVASDLGELRALAVMRSGEVWVAGRGGVEILGEVGGRPLTMADGLPSDVVNVLLPDGGGGMWIGTDRGLARWSAGAISIPGGAEGLGAAPVERLYRDREGTLWVATNRTVARVTEGRVDLSARRSRLTGVLSIFEDREGSVWFGTDNAGLTVLREQPFSTISEQDGLSAGAVRAIFQDREGTIWIGTNGGGLNRVEGGRASAAMSHAALSSDVVLALAQTGTGLWVGTPNGLNLIRNGAVRVFTTESGLADDFVRSLFADRDGSLWIGTRNGLSHLVDGRFTSYSTLDGLGSDLIGTILRSRTGDLWIGTLGGLSRFEGNGFVTLRRKDGLGSDAVTALLEDGAGTLWVGTQDAGLSRVQDGRAIALAPGKTGLPETVFGMLEDAAGDLWMSSRRGIYRVSAAALNRVATAGQGGIPPRRYGIEDGMRISEGSSGGHPAAWRMQDGSLWFATLDGAALVAPELTANNQLPPPTVIEQVLLNDRPIVPERVGAEMGLVVPPGERRIEVQYAGLSFVAPQKVRYRYRLEGFDKEWVEAGARREAFYTNVPPGRYRFRVLSSNNDGVWSTEAATFAVRIRPTLFQTWWFYGLVALALGGLAFLIYRWRVLTVEAQYKAVLQERGRIAREIHDTLAQGYVAISVQLEIAGRLLEVSKEAALGQLEETKELVRGSLADARSSIWNLRSQTEAETLPSRLAALTESRSRRDGPALKLEIKGAYRPVAPVVESEILRVAQESVTNAIRHAGAKQIRVTLRYDASTLELQVRDDGRGFAETAANRTRDGHFGVQGMRERAERIGANLTVSSRQGVGTVVDLRIDPRRTEKEDLI